MKRAFLVLALLAGGCVSQTPPASSYAVQAAREDSARLVRIGHHVEALSQEQRRVMARYASIANGYRPHIADDLIAALNDGRYAAYTAQLDIVHEFAVVQDKLVADMVFNRRPDVIALQSEMAGTQEALIGARQEYNFAAAIYLDRVKKLPAGSPHDNMIEPAKVSWYSEHNGAESARSATVFDDDGD